MRPACTRLIRPVWKNALRDRGPVAPAHGHLWNSYKDALPLISKIYAAGGRYRGDGLERLSVRWLTHVNQCNSEAPNFRPAFRRDFHMLDLILLALGLGLFALSLIYAYACDRL